ncbi:sulfatase [Catenovulum agarivorans]|uniref:sulfatase family protein n=1 Tax=Catenovulum agarivorans TaxID=1172192 RepID=UPI001ED97F81|nr:sulfatase [Catenovulum agarivorans]
MMNLLKPYLKHCAALAGLFTLVACTQEPVVTQPIVDEKTQQQPLERPNILFILADDHRWDLIGKYHDIIKTPNLDQLADKGTVFKNAFVTTPICASSRVSILTGLTERTHDFTFQQPATGVEESALVYPRILKENGYQSAFIGKYEIKLSGEDSDRFDYFKPLLQAKTETYKGQALPQTYYIAELAKDFISQSKSSDKPWVMAVNFWNPHAHDRDEELQFHYPEEFESWYQDVEIPAAKLSTDADFAALPEPLQQSAARVRWQFRFGSPELYQQMTKRHYRAISSVDKAVGMIYQALEAQGMADNTIIIYTGDNGYAMNERQLAGKWFGWEEDLRVPLIIYDPRNKKADTQEIEKLALNIDITPTILDFAGVAAPASYQGQSLLPLITQTEKVEWRDEFFFEHMYQPKRFLIPPMAGVRSEQWKYVDFYKHDHVQLYNLADDPDEQYNLADKAEYTQVKQQMAQKLAGYINQYEDARSAEVKARGTYPNSH